MRSRPWLAPEPTPALASYRPPTRPATSSAAPPERCRSLRTERPAYGGPFGCALRSTGLSHGQPTVDGLPVCASEMRRTGIQCAQPQDAAWLKRGQYLLPCVSERNNQCSRLQAAHNVHTATVGPRIKHLVSTAPGIRKKPRPSPRDSK